MMIWGDIIERYFIKWNGADFEICTSYNSTRSAELVNSGWTMILKTEAQKLIKERKKKNEKGLQTRS